MRFNRIDRYEPLTFSDRKKAAFARKQQRERERYPLFADHVAEEQHSSADEIVRRQRRSDRCEQRMRDLYARIWREARARFFARPDDTKAKIRNAWAMWTGPTTCKYFAYIVDLHSGELARRSETSTQRAAAARRRALASLSYQAELEVQ